MGAPKASEPSPEQFVLRRKITERQKELWVTEQALAAHVAKQCIKQVMQPDDIVGTVLFLASDASRMLTAQMLIVDGGFL